MSQSNPFTLYPPKGHPIQLRFEDSHLHVSPEPGSHLTVSWGEDGSLRIYAEPGSHEITDPDQVARVLGIAEDLVEGLRD